ncbi:MAG: helix-hairpin-helix domain-containing protein [Desulfobacula sp.]|jgi:competence protein ComEA
MKQFKKISLIIMTGLLLLSFCQPLMAADVEKININTASQQELMKLKYVGEKMAEKIIAYRKDKPFQKPEDIMDVKGVGEKIFNANKEMIIVKNK